MDRVPIPMVVGSLAGRQGDEWLAARIGSEAVAVRLHLVLDVAPGAGESVTVELRDEAGGSGSAISATISGTDREATATGSLASNASGELWTRLGTVSSNGGQAATDLSGWFEVEGAAGVTATALTSVARVKEYLGETGSSHDTLLNRIVLGVSEAMQSYMHRRILQSQVTRRFSHYGETDTLTLPDPPAADNGALAVELGRVDETPESLTKDEDFEIDEDTATLVRIGSHWPKGRRNIKVTWDKGYASVPEDLTFAATKQSAYEWQQAGADPSNARLGLQGTILGTGDSSYVVRDWIQGVEAVMRRYREPAF